MLLMCVCSVIFVFLHYPSDVKNTEIYRFTLTHNTKLYYLQFIQEIIHTSKLTILSLVKCLEKIVDCSNLMQVMEWSNQFIQEIINTSKLTILQAVFSEMSGEDC